MASNSIQELDLKPSTDHVGELHGQAPSKPVDRYLALCPPKSMFQYQIISGLEIHGLHHGKPATLLTFKAHFQPEKQARPIKWAAITAYFTPETTSTHDSLQIEAFAPGQPTVKVGCSMESDTLRKSIKGNVGVDQYAKAGIEGSREHETSKEMQYAATVSGSAYSSHVGGDAANTMRWILDGNRSQNSGIPPDITLGVILLRADESNFVGTVQVDIQVDWKHEVETWCAPFRSYKKWGNITRHKIYSPSKNNENKYPGEVENAHLEKLTANRKALLKTLMKIEMPEKYMYEE